MRTFVSSDFRLPYTSFLPSTIAAPLFLHSRPQSPPIYPVPRPYPWPQPLPTNLHDLRLINDNSTVYSFLYNSTRINRNRLEDRKGVELTTTNQSTEETSKKKLCGHRES